MIQLSNLNTVVSYSTKYLNPMPNIKGNLIPDILVPQLSEAYFSNTDAVMETLIQQ